MTQLSKCNQFTEALLLDPISLITESLSVLSYKQPMSI